MYNTLHTQTPKNVLGVIPMAKTKTGNGRKTSPKRGGKGQAKRSGGRKNRNSQVVNVMKSNKERTLTVEYADGTIKPFPFEIFEDSATA